MKKIFKSLIVGVFIILCSLQSHATLVKPLSLSQITKASDTIVRVHLKDKALLEDTEESGRLVIYYTFEVLEWLKTSKEGDTVPLTSETLIIKQLATGRAYGYNNAQALQVPEYEVNRDYVLFLPKAHPKSGLVAPIALDQGVFELVASGDKLKIKNFEQRRQILAGQYSQNKTQMNAKMAQKIQSTSDDYESFRQLVMMSQENAQGQ